MASIEEKVEEHFKKVLDNLGVRHFGKTESINEPIDKALKNFASKSGNSGNNYPDIRCLLDNKQGRLIPVMIEAKGSKNKLEKLSKDGRIVGVTYNEKKRVKSQIKNNSIYKSGDEDYSAIIGYAVNGALHYGNAILNGGDYEEVIIIGINGTMLDKRGNLQNPECKAYYVSLKNNKLPRLIKEFDDSFILLKQNNIKKLYDIVDKLNLTDQEIEDLSRKTEISLEKKVKDIHQKIYDGNLKNLLTVNEKLYLFCGLIMAGLTTKNVKPLEVSELSSDNDENTHDGKKMLTHISSFLNKKNMNIKKIEMIKNLISPIFDNKNLWQPNNGESHLKSLYRDIKNDIIPLLESNLHLDFTGKVLNSLNDWVQIDNDHNNDVVLTPRYITTLMAKLARTNKDSLVWDSAMGSAGFLVSALDIMIKDATNSISDSKELAKKINTIKEKQLLGIEILGNVYLLAVLNMILMGDGSSNIINDDSHKCEFDFNGNVFLLNPPYSAPGKGLNFVEEAFNRMENGYGCVLIQENAGERKGLPYSKRILEKNTLIASIHMPKDLFIGKSGAQTAIYLFRVGRAHEKNDIVMFIDFSNDGYKRLARSKSTDEVNLRDDGTVKERYEEIEAIILNKKAKSKFYTEKNGLLIKDTITLEGNDWTYSQHQKIDMNPKEGDYKKIVSQYMLWQISLKIEKNQQKKKTNKINKKEYKKYRLQDIFEIEGTKSLDAGSLEFINEGINFVGRIDENNGIQGKISKQSFEPNEANTITATVIGNYKYVKYQSEPYYCSQNINKLRLKEKFKVKMNENIGMYFITQIQKFVSKYNGQQSGYILEDIKNHIVSVPVKNKNIDFKYIEKYIKSLKKEIKKCIV